MNNVKSNGISHSLRLRRLGIDTYQHAVIYMRRDCHVSVINETTCVSIDRWRPESC
jgi:hypothetical protein